MSRQNNNNNDAIRWSTNWLRWEVRWCDGKRQKKCQMYKKNSLTIYCVYLPLLLLLLLHVAVGEMRKKKHFFWEIKTQKNEEVEDAMK